MSTSPVSTSRARRIGAVAASALLTLGLGATHLAAPVGAQESEPAPDEQSSASIATKMTFNGRGYGHGRGLSQYGAQGYATTHGGWSSDQILDHYYGGTRKGTIAEASNQPIDPDRVRIRLRRAEGRDTRVTVTNGTLQLSGLGSVSLPSGTKAVHLNHTSNGFEVWAASKTTCSASDFEQVGNTGTTQVDLRPTATYDGTAGNLLRLCTGYGAHGPSGPDIWYPGTLRAHVAGGDQQTVNITTIEQQLRSVVPNESPSSWDIDALQAQAVAARSYALSGDGRWTGADTCDTIYCQVYYGLYKLENGSPVRTTATSTDTAIKNTAGVVRLHTDSGRIARTEFSSTSGGWTAGGTFPAVRDEGDAISPLHTWTRTVELTSLERSYGKGGRLVEIEVLSRNGLGPDGGRVKTARLHFDNGVTADVSGNTVRSASRLLSDWFTPVCGSELRYVHAVFELFLGRVATGAEAEAHCGDVRRGERSSLTRALAVSDEWAGVQIAELYQKILDRSGESEGRAYWLSQVERGLRIEDIAAQFYGSAEYFQRAGGTNRGYIEALYEDLLGRTADAEGRDHWVRNLDARRISRQTAAESFYASIESRTDRVDGLFRQILGRAPDAEGRSYWTGQLLTLGDVSLAAWLAASPEYYQDAVA